MNISRLYRKLVHIGSLLRFCAGSCKVKTGPLRVCLYVTDRCNAKCKACEIWKIKKTQSGWLTTERAKALFEELANMNVLNILLVGGEPTLRKDICELIAYAKAVGLKTSMTTNCIFFNEKMADKLCTSGLDRIYFSLDTLSPELHDELRGVPGCFDKVMNAIKLMKARKTNNYPKLLISYVMSKKTIHEFPRIVRFVEEEKLDGLTCQIIHDIERYDLHPTPDLPLSSEDIIDVEKSINEVINKNNWSHLLMEGKLYYDRLMIFLKDANECYRYRCVAGYAFAEIVGNGDVFPCAQARGKKFLMGNLQQNSFTQIWFSQQAQSVRNKIKCNNHPPCWLTGILPMNIFLHNVHPIRFHRLIRGILLKKFYSLIKE